MSKTLKNRPKQDAYNAYGCKVYDSKEMNEWFEDFEKRQKEILEFTGRWISDNIEAIHRHFKHHFASGLTLEELIQFFIKKEILGEEP